MKSRAKHLMEFVDKQGIMSGVGWLWLDDAETKLNQFLEKQSDPRLKDAKDEVESLRMELRETRKTLKKSQEDFDQLQWDV